MCPKLYLLPGPFESKWQLPFYLMNGLQKALGKWAEEGGGRQRRG